MAVGLADSLAEVGSAFERRLESVAGVIATRSRDEIAELREFDAPEFWAEVRDITRGSRRAQAQHLSRRRELPGACPEPDARAAQLAVRTGVSFQASLKSYRIGHAVAWDAWLDSIEEAELGAGPRMPCLRAVSRFVDAYDTRLADLFAAEYRRASNQMRPASQRVSLVRDVLEGLSEDAEGLDYNLHDQHVALIGSGAESATSMRRLARLLDRRLLLVEVSKHVHWGWLGGAEAMRVGELAELARFQSAPGALLCVGSPGAGPAGFRHSHREAGDAYLVARRRPQPLTLYVDVALEALALRDESAARDFAVCQLRGLDGDDRLLETLRQYFTSSQNAAATAAALGIHEQTVTRRLRTVERKLGCQLNARRAELDLALRLDELLSGSTS